MLTLPGTHQTCTWHSTGWQWPTPVSTPSSTTGWIKGILFPHILLSLDERYQTVHIAGNGFGSAVVWVFSNLIRRCGLQSPFNHQFCLTCMSRTSFGKYIDSYHWVKKWKRQIAVRFINLIANKKKLVIELSYWSDFATTSTKPFVAPRPCQASASVSSLEAPTLGEGHISFNMSRCLTTQIEF